MNANCHRHWGWVVVITSFCVLLVVFGVVFSFGDFFVEFQDEFNSSATLTGWVGSIAHSFAVLLALPFNLLVERFGHHHVCLIGILLATAGLVLTSLMSTLPPMFATYSVMFGSGVCIFSLAPVTLLSAYFPSKHSVRALSLALAGSNAGMFVYAPFVNPFIKRYGWRVTMRILAALMFGVGLPCSLTFSEPRQREGDHRGDQTMTSSEQQELVTIVDVVDDDRKSPPEEVASEDNSFGEGLVDGAEQGVKLDSENMCQDDGNSMSLLVSLGINETVGSRLLTLMGAFSMAGKLLLSFGAELLPFPTLFLMIIIALVNCGVMMSFIFVRSTVLLYIIGRVIGVLLGMSSCLTYTISHRFFDPERGKGAWPIIATCNGLGFLLSSLSGQSIDWLGSYSSALIAFVALYGVVVVLLMTAPIYTSEVRRSVSLRVHGETSAKSCGNSGRGSQKYRH
ncbi:monocarboxylate transporter 9-like [Diadema antillarum]|uniref:monocarboxylate transporter 9-like n=1 Tax=Diadema antillarum TaxID=105358 RepID=UPI003A89B0CF